MSRLTAHQEKALADTPVHEYDKHVAIRWSRFTMERLANLGYVHRQQQKELPIDGQAKPAYMRSDKGTQYLRNQIKKTMQLQSQMRRRRSGR